MTLHIQNYDDWDRYEAVEAGRDAAPVDPDADVTRYLEEIDSALMIEEFMLAFRYGNMPSQDAGRSPKLFAAEVLPAVHEFPALEPISYRELPA